MYYYIISVFFPNHYLVFITIIFKSCVIFYEIYVPFVDVIFFCFVFSTFNYLKGGKGPLLNEHFHALTLLYLGLFTYNGSPKMRLLVLKIRKPFWLLK